MPRIRVALEVPEPPTVLVVDEDLLSQRKLEAVERAKFVAEGELALARETAEAERRAIQSKTAAECAAFDAQKRATEAEEERREAEWVRDNPVEAKIRDDRRRQDTEEKQRASERSTAATLKIVAGAAVGAAIAFMHG